jgi:hypothetical protein
MVSRKPEWEGKVFTDDQGIPYEGQRFTNVPSEKTSLGMDFIEIWYHEGKVHGDPAIQFPDGLIEQWDNGVFIKVSEQAYGHRT